MIEEDFKISNNSGTENREEEIPESEILKNILITGTPGVGKTSMSILLADEIKNSLGLDYTVINVGELIHKSKLYDNWNNDFDVPEFNEDKVLDALECVKDGGYIVDFHTADFFPEHWFKLVVLLRCNNTELYDRLNQRGYKEKKITENIECEIMDVLADEVKNSYSSSRIIELNNEKIDDMQDNIQKIVLKYKEVLERK